jgi:hypothetical protein
MKSYSHRFLLSCSLALILTSLSAQAEDQAAGGRHAATVRFNVSGVSIALLFKRRQDIPLETNDSI